MQDNYYTTLNTPLGKIILTSYLDKITGLYLPDHPHYTEAQNLICKPEIFSQACHQLEKYFQKKLTEFNLPLSPIGTEFQQKVWNVLETVKHGTTASYRDIAKKINNEKAVRAVGSANSKNPICIIIPCHRIIAANGNLSGYAGGVEAKKWLLAHEQQI